MPESPRVDPSVRATHLRWLGEVTQLPTAAGREQRVIAWLRGWVAARPALMIDEDPCGNLTIRRRHETAAAPPVYFTAHLDHPAFVVEEVLSPTALAVSFRGGVMDDYFREARVIVHTASGAVPARLTGERPAGIPMFKHYTAECAAPCGASAGDVAVWDVPPAGVEDGNFCTLACDDLAALAAALGALDVLLASTGGPPAQDVRLLCTRAEEIGFVGAIGACRHGTIPRAARVIALENSRSFADSPIGGGPIVRVGDRISVFSPGLTAAIAKRAEEIAGGAATVTAAQKLSEMPAWKWQRKLMSGGACEASVFCNAGYEATCVCLPLGNYHNMADLDAVQAGTNTTPPRVAREFIGVRDFEGLVDLLVACGERLGAGPSLAERFEKLWNERRSVLG